MNHETAAEPRMMPGAIDIPAGEDLGDIGPAPPEARLIYSVFYGCGPLSESQRRDFLASLPKPDKPAAPKKLAAKDINNLIESVRSGHPPELPKGKKGNCKREHFYRDPALPNLGIRLLDTGVASWVVQYKRLGRQKKETLGDVRVVDRLEAIKAAKDLLAKVQLRMLDPQEAKRERMRANKVTFATLVPLFIEHKKQQKELKPQTETIWKAYLTAYHFQPLHNFPIDEITSEQLQTRFDDIVVRSGNQTGRNCHTAMRVFFKWAVRSKKLPQGHHNPMLDVERPPAGSKRKRVLNDDEIRLIWKALDDWEDGAIQQERIGQKPKAGMSGQWWNPNNADFPRAIKLLFLTGCRRREIGELHWSEVDLDNAELRIPGSRRKSQVSQEEELELFVPLADWAVQILRRIPRRPNNDFVFGGREKVFGINLTGVRDRINQRIAGAGHPSPLDWRLHDIRRTFRTRMAALKVTMDVGEALLGHVGHRSDVVRIYDQYEYWPEKKQALAKWVSHLRAVIAGTAAKIATPEFGKRKKGGPA
jgi:integrase